MQTEGAHAQKDVLRVLAREDTAAALKKHPFITHHLNHYVNDDVNHG
jgi:hypothetical protein